MFRWLNRKQLAHASQSSAPETCGEDRLEFYSMYTLTESVAYPPIVNVRLRVLWDCWRFGCHNCGPAPKTPPLGEPVQPVQRMDVSPGHPMTRAGTSPCCAFDRGQSTGSDLPASVSLGVPPLVGLFLKAFWG